MATARYNAEAYGYEDVTPVVAARQGYAVPTYTPPRPSAERYGYEDAPPDVNAEFARPMYSPPLARPDGMGERCSSYAGAGAVAGNFAGMNLNLNDFDKATTLSNNSNGSNVDWPRRATMSFGEHLHAPPPGFGGRPEQERNRSGSEDSDFLSSMLISGSPDAKNATQQHHNQHQHQHQHNQRNSMQEGMYPVSDQTFGGPRRNSLQEAIARSNPSPHDPPPHHPHHRQHHSAIPNVNVNHGNQGPRRSPLQQHYGAPQRAGSIGGGGGAAGYGGRSQRYDSHSAHSANYHAQSQAAAGPGGGFAAPPSSEPTGPLYMVKLKRNQRTFVLGPRIKSKLVTGTYVKVEADRGEDLGIVIGEAPPEQPEAPRRSSYGGFEPSRRSSNGGKGGGRENNRDSPKKILRLATKEEVALLATRRQEEVEMHQLCMQKVRERGLDMRIVDAEYQFDRNKLTFYFEAERRVDFRDLVRELFMICGTRIWMCQINTYATSTASRPATEAAHEDDDNNVPIIAPASEFLG
jgi:hypothetical protein